MYLIYGCFIFLISMIMKKFFTRFDLLRIIALIQLFFAGCANGSGGLVLLVKLCQKIVRGILA